MSYRLAALRVAAVLVTLYCLWSAARWTLRLIADIAYKATT